MVDKKVVKSDEGEEGGQTWMQSKKMVNKFSTIGTVSFFYLRTPIKGDADSSWPWYLARLSRHQKLGSIFDACEGVPARVSIR